MTVSKKIKTINLYRKAAKISAGDGNVNKCELLTGKHVVP